MHNGQVAPIKTDCLLLRAQSNRRPARLPEHQIPASDERDCELRFCSKPSAATPDKCLSRCFPVTTSEMTSFEHLQCESLPAGKAAGNRVEEEGPGVASCCQHQTTA